MANNPNKKEKNPNPYKDPTKTQQFTPQTKPGKYLFGVKKEVEKVTWPSKTQLVTGTAVVIVCISFFSVIFWGIDTGILSAMKALLNM